MQAVADEAPDVSGELDTDPLTTYDAERQRVVDAISDRFATQDTEEIDLVPTECLGEELETVLELPAGFSEGRIATLVALHPWRVVLTVLLL